MPKNSSIATGQYFAPLDSLRGVACLVVVIFHLPDWNQTIYSFPLLRSGYLLVEFFFVLSGFVLLHTYQCKLHSKHDLRDFMLLRVGRLYPVHIVFLLLFLAFEIAKIVATSQFGIQFPNGRPFGVNNFHAFAESALLIQALGLSGNAETFNYPSWSISTEFYTYILFALLLSSVRKARFTIIALGIVVTCTSAQWILGDQLGDFRWMARCLNGFFTGCLLQKIYLSRKEERTTPYFDVVASAGLLGYLSLTVHTTRQDILMVPLSAILIYTIIKDPQGIVARILERSLLRWLGAISYSLYMSHAAVIFVGKIIARVVFERLHIPVKETVLMAPLSWMPYIFTVGSAVALGWLVYRFIEVPSRDFSRSFVLRLHKPATTGLLR